MHRVKGRKYPNDNLYKQYLIETDRLNRSDRILITSLVGLESDVYTTISYRKLFIKTTNRNWGVYRIKNEDFRNWVLMKQRLNKISKLKTKIL